MTTLTVSDTLSYRREAVLLVAYTSEAHASTRSLSPFLTNTGCEYDVPLTKSLAHGGHLFFQSSGVVL